MNIFKIEKTIGNLPSTISSNTIYLVRSGEGFKLFCSDITGTIAHPLESDFIIDGGKANSSIDYIINIDFNNVN